MANGRVVSGSDVEGGSDIRGFMSEAEGKKSSSNLFSRDEAFRTVGEFLSRELDMSEVDKVSSRTAMTVAN